MFPWGTLDRGPSLAEGHCLGTRLPVLPGPSAHLCSSQLEASEISILSHARRIWGVLYLQCPREMKSVGGLEGLPPHGTVGGGPQNFSFSFHLSGPREGTHLRAGGRDVTG